MMLIVGAAGAGKRAYVRSLGFAETEIADGVLDDRPVLYNLQDIVFADPDGSEMLCGLLFEKAVVVCNEVGSGVIPVSSEARKAREATGRLCNRLAERADTVVRIVCGISIILKG